MEFHSRLFELAQGALQRDERAAHAPLLAHFAPAPGLGHCDRDTFFVDVESNVTMLFHVLVLLEFNWLIDRSEPPILRLCPALNGTTRALPWEASTLSFPPSRSHNV